MGIDGWCIAFLLIGCGDFIGWRIGIGLIACRLGLGVWCFGDWLLCRGWGICLILFGVFIVGHLGCCVCLLIVLGLIGCLF